MEVPQIMYSVGDPALIETIVGELKSQGTFDQFRKECIADVDTKPAYQNLHQRVESTVSNFLEGRVWRPDLNKNQLRDSLRKHIHEMGFLETGVERIVDQVVNPKVNTVFMPQVEDVVYRVQGLPKPDKKSATNALGSTSKNGGLFSAGVFSQPPPFLPGLSFLPPALQNHIQKPPTLDDLLPKDLDPVSPESSKESLDGQEPKEEYENSTRAEDIGLIKHHDDSMDSQLSGISDLTSHGSDHNQNPKLERKTSPVFNVQNEDSQSSKVSSNSRLSHKSQENMYNRPLEDAPVDSKDIVESKESIHQKDSNEKHSSPTDPVMQYGDQFSKEEEVATSATHYSHDEALEYNKVKVEAKAPNSPYKGNLPENANNVETMSSEDVQLKTSPAFYDSINQKCETSEELNSTVVDDNLLLQSEDSHLSGSSDSKLHIDELKDFNSQSENSHLNEDEKKSKAAVENIVEASEEARHGFDDSQDALERPPLPWAPPASGRPPLPPLPPPGSSLCVEGAPLPPPTPPPQSPSRLQISPSTEVDAIDKHESRPTLPVANTPERLCVSPIPPPGDAYSGHKQPLPPQPPVGIACPPARPSGTLTPPLVTTYTTEKPPPRPQTPTADDFERPGTPSTPPLAEKYKYSKESPLPPTSQVIASTTPPAFPEEEFSRDSNTSPPYYEGAVPKTPRWEPRSPGMDDERLKEISYPVYDYLGVSVPNQLQQSLATSSNPNNEQDEVSQSSSEDMQLAWSPLSFHGELPDEPSSGKNSRNEQFQHNEKSLVELEKLQMSPKDSTIQEKSRAFREPSDDQLQESKKNEKHKSGDKYDYDKYKIKDKSRDGKSRDKHKEDHKSHKISSSSSKKHDEKSSKHRDSHDRKDSGSRSRHDDKKRSDKDRGHTSSHHRSDDKKREERDRNSSSKHKSSRSDDRHRHRERDRKNSSGSSHTHHDAKGHDKTSKTEDKSKLLSKSHSSDRDRRERDRKERDLKDKDKKSEKSKDYSGKESSKLDEKKKEKEREKEKKEKSFNVCRPNNERRSPNPDSNNGSTSVGYNHTSTTFSSNDSQYQNRTEQDSKDVTNSNESNNKPTDSSQLNSCCSDLSLSSSTNQSVSPSSSLPFKKRPLLPESGIKQEFLSGQLILKIKKARKSDYLSQDPRTRRKKAIRRLESKSVQNLDNGPKFTSKGGTKAESPPPYCGSPMKYFDNDWPTKSDDEAFMTYVKGLELSKTLSGMSDFSDSDSEEEEILNVDDVHNTYGSEDKSFKLSLSLLTDNEASKLSTNSLEVFNTKRKEAKGKTKESKVNSVIGKTNKNRSRLRKSSEDGDDAKRGRMSLNKDITHNPPVEQKSRRARKPNKRYSNEEFTSHFDYDELDSPEDEILPVCLSSNSEEMMEAMQSECKRLELSSANHENIDEKQFANFNHQEKENISLDSVSENVAHVSSENPKKLTDQRHQATFSWNQDAYNSNSEDEMDSSNTQSDLIGTALKNLMMESGLGGSEEAFDSKKLLCKPSPLTNTYDSLSGKRKNSMPLSGVKRVGLSKFYKGNKKSQSKDKVKSVLPGGKCMFPLRSRSDLSSLACDESTRNIKKGCSSDSTLSETSAESTSRKIDNRFVKLEGEGVS